MSVVLLSLSPPFAFVSFLILFEQTKSKFHFRHRSMLVTSSQPSTQRPLGLSIEELYALDRQYRRIEQQQQHLTQLQNQVHLAPSNLNRVTSRSLDYISKQSPLSALPSLEVHGHAYSYRPQPAAGSLLNYPRSHSIDQMRYMPSVPSTPSSALLKSAYHQRSGAAHDTMHQRYHSRHRNYLQVNHFDNKKMADAHIPTCTRMYIHSIQIKCEKEKRTDYSLPAVVVVAFFLFFFLKR